MAKPTFVKLWVKEMNEEKYKEMAKEVFGDWLVEVFVASGSVNVHVVYTDLVSIKKFANLSNTRFICMMAEMNGGYDLEFLE